MAMGRLGLRAFLVGFGLLAHASAYVQATPITTESANAKAVDRTRHKLQRQLLGVHDGSGGLYSQFRDTDGFVVGSGYDPSTGVYVHDYGQDGIRALGDSLVITDSAYPINFQQETLHSISQQGHHHYGRDNQHGTAGRYRDHEGHGGVHAASGRDDTEHNALEGHHHDDGRHHHHPVQHSEYQNEHSEVPITGPAYHHKEQPTAQQGKHIPQERSSEHSHNDNPGPQQFFHRGSSRIPIAPRSGALYCQKEGLYRHPNDCSKFYRCISGRDLYLEAVQFDCAPGLAFDETSASCTWPDNVPACARFSALPSERYPALNNHPLKSPDILPRARPTGNQSPRWPTVELPQSASQPGPNQNPVEMFDRNPVYPTTDVGEDPRCVHDGLIPAPPCTRRFYRCESLPNGAFRLHKYTCYDGMVFDPAIPGCIEVVHYPECQGHIHPPSTTPRSIPSPTTRAPELLPPATTMRPSPNVIDPSLIIPGKKVINDCGPEFEGDRCTPFYKCRDSSRRSRAFRFECPQDLVFDPQTQECAYPSEVEGCQAFILDKPSGNGIPSTGKTFDVDESKVVSFPCSSPGFYKVANNCSRFIRCFTVSNDSLVLRAASFDCPRGLAFDEVAGACNHASLVSNCRDDVIQHSNDILTMKCEFDPVYQDFCTPFYRCSDDSQRVIRFSCPKDLVYDVKIQKCNYPYNVKECRTAPPPKNDLIPAGGFCTGNGFIRSSTNCSLFYRCTRINNHTEEFATHLFSCPPGLVFDYTIDACNYDYVVTDCGYPLEAKKTAASLPDLDVPTSMNKAQRPSNGEMPAEERSSFDKRRPSTSGANGGVSSAFAFVPGTNRLLPTLPPAIDVVPPRRRPAQTVIVPRPSGEEGQSSSSGFGFRPGSAVTESVSSESPNSEIDESFLVTSASQMPGDDYPCLQEGFFRDIDHCQIFHRCVRTDDPRRPLVAHRFKCKEGLVFDDALKNCNYEAMVSECGQQDVFVTRPPRQPTSPARRPISVPATELPSLVTERAGLRSTTPLPKPHKPTFAWRPGTITPPKRRRRPSTHRPQTTPEPEMPILPEIVEPVQSPKMPAPTDSADKRGFNFKDNMRPTLPLAPSRPARPPTQTSAPVRPRPSTRPSEHVQPTRPPMRRLAQPPGRPLEQEFVVAEDEVIIENRIVQDTRNDENEVEIPVSFKCNPEVFYKKSTRFCTPFYRCTRTIILVSGNKQREIIDTYRYGCPNGLMFNRELNTCDYPSNMADCEHPDPDEILPAPAVGYKSSVPCSREGFFGHPNQCKRYYRCVQVSRQRFFTYDYECPRGFVFNPEKGNCGYPDQVQGFCKAPAAAVNASRCVSIGLERSTSECSQFYRCAQPLQGFEPQALPLACPRELVLIEGSCQWPDRRDVCYREDDHRRIRLLGNDRSNNATKVK
ncbi:hypothetical protein BIW11_09234 [Tropilaelaps mercedesae]|uniref:Chitin-binding type-2 domain-containing protein n=1 Tax=Tropilaelaps mercedesae TaxID=418985 RepID=A0A1V9XLC4_9ACAR|nr:hypothetical protein BIW11_09234 [Tropilaelaps mercedesae]